MPVPELQAFVDVPLISLHDGQQCTFTLRRDTVTNDFGKGRNNYIGYAADVYSPWNSSHSIHAIAFDRQPGKEHGTFRAVMGHNGLLGERLDFCALRLTAGLSSYDEPAVSFLGRLFLSERAYNILRKTYAPDEAERIEARLASTEKADTRIDRSSDPDATGDRSWIARSTTSAAGVLPSAQAPR